MKVRLLIALGLPWLALAAPASAAVTVDFACGWPVREIYENKALSKYMQDHDERVFDVKVGLNGPTPKEGIAIAPKHFGVCRIILPLGRYLRYPLSWREARGSDHGVYKSLQVQEAEGGGSHSDWLLIRPLNLAASGVATLEVTVNFDRLDQGGLLGPDRVP